MGRQKSNAYVTIRLQNKRFGLQIEQSQPFTIVGLNWKAHYKKLWEMKEKV